MAGYRTCRPIFAVHLERYQEKYAPSRKRSDNIAHANHAKDHLKHFNLLQSLKPRDFANRIHSPSSFRPHPPNLITCNIERLPSRLLANHSMSTTPLLQTIHLLRVSQTTKTHQRQNLCLLSSLPTNGTPCSDFTADMHHLEVPKSTVRVLQGSYIRNDGEQ